MGSSSDFYEIFATEPNALTGVSFARYMELAMYHPTAGYYTRDFKRVGRDNKADFFTATTFSPVFGELVVAAVVKLLAPARPADFTFVEVAAEPGAGILRDVPHPFAKYQTISYGQPFVFPAQSVVFSNELFDAQPINRVVWREGRWRELGVALTGRTLREVELPEVDPRGGGLCRPAAAERARELPHRPAAAHRAAPGAHCRAEVERAFPRL